MKSIEDPYQTDLNNHRIQTTFLQMDNTEISKTFQEDISISSLNIDIMNHKNIQDNYDRHPLCPTIFATEKTEPLLSHCVNNSFKLALSRGNHTDHLPTTDAFILQTEHHESVLKNETLLKDCWCAHNTPITLQETHDLIERNSSINIQHKDSLSESGKVNGLQIKNMVPTGKLSRVLSVNEPPRFPDLTHQDIMIKEMKWMQQSFSSEYRTKLKICKILSTAAIKFLAGKDQRVSKQKEEEIKRLKYTAKTIAINIKHFWKVIQTIVSQRQQVKRRLKEELREEKEAKQIELVTAASTFAHAISDGLRSWDSGLDPLMIRTSHTPTFQCSTWVQNKQDKQLASKNERVEDDDDVSMSEQWSEQEEEDVALDAIMNDSRNDSDLNSEDELEALKQEAVMNLEKLKETFNIQDDISMDSKKEKKTWNHISTEFEDKNLCHLSTPLGHTSSYSTRSKRCRDHVVNQCHLDTQNLKNIELDESNNQVVTSLLSEGVSSSTSLLNQHVLKDTTGSQLQESNFSDKRQTSVVPPVFQLTQASNEIDAKQQQIQEDSSHQRIIVESIPGLCPVPFLLRATLRTYQHEGLTWLLTLHDNAANGILADEMGLGKTIQTIALLAYLACYRGVWGPHLIVAPSSVILNWEAEFQRFLPGFKILTYYGGRKERERKRQGWSDALAFNVCIVSYTLVVADAHIFKRKPWYYMVLDEAQHIKNYQSQKWQAMLNFNSQRRILLTGTPLQNDLSELWSLMHFLMPRLFESHTDWKELFSDPLTRAIEASSVEKEQSLVSRLHDILRPFLLRRLKRDVEGQMPSKYEHVVRCVLSKRQRALYNEFIENQTTKDTMESSDYFGLLNILMQLRKICNHPDLLAPREVSCQFNDSLGVSLTVPRCVHLGITEPWTKHWEQNLDQLEIYHPLMSLALGEMLGWGFPENEIGTELNQTGLMESEEQPFIIQTSCRPINSSNYDTDYTLNSSSSKMTVQQVKKYERDCALELNAFPLIKSPSLFTSPSNNIQHMLKNQHVDDNSHTDMLKDFRKQTTFPCKINIPSECLTCNPIQRLLFGPILKKSDIISDSHKNTSLITELNQFAYKSDSSQTKISNLLNYSIIPPPTHISQFSNQHASFNISSPPPLLSDSICKCLQYPENIISPYRSICYHSTFHAPTDYTSIASLSQLPTLPSLTTHRYPGSANCVPLEALCVQTNTRYKNQHWLDHSWNRLRVPTKTSNSMGRPTSSNRGLLALYRKTLFEKARSVGADPKTTVSDETGLAAQWVHCAATAVGIIRRAANLEYLVEHPVVDDDSFFHDFHNISDAPSPYLPVSSYKTFHFNPSNEKRLSRLRHRSLWGPHFRSWLQCQVWSPSNGLPFLSLHRCSGIDSLLNLQGLDGFFSCVNTLDLLQLSPINRLREHFNLYSRLLCVHHTKVRCVGQQLFLRGRGGPNYESSFSTSISAGYSFLKDAAGAFHPIDLAQRCLFPLKMSLQHDCGKMVLLAGLLRRLKTEGHKCILFTQMSRMLDVLEGFLNLHNFTYVRLDGSTKIEQRQRVVDAFNTDPRIFIFMSSTRAGGVGLNLIGGDTVIFYDTDWNPAMDRQAMDRCHRIGQTRDVHVYRLITEYTIEENILRKQLLKRMLDDIVVDQGTFTTEKISDFIDRGDVKTMFTTTIDASDLYTTRILHESSNYQLCPALSMDEPDESATLFATTIAQLEEADNRTDNDKYLSLGNGDSIPEMIDADIELSDSMTPVIGDSLCSTVPYESLMSSQDVLHQDTDCFIVCGGTQITPHVINNHSQHTDTRLDPPFWIKQKPQQSIDLNISPEKSMITIDDKTTVYVSQVVELAIHFIEHNLPQSILTDLALLQQRINIFKASHHQQSNDDSTDLTIYSQNNHLNELCSSPNKRKQSQETISINIKDPVQKTRHSQRARIRTQ